MKLTELTDGCNTWQISGNASACDVKGVAYDSRHVRPGDLFICIRGFQQDGHRFLEEALKKGACGVVSESKLALPPGIPLVVVPDSRAALAQISQRFFGNPSRRIRLIGVTGTNGKTTVTHMVEAILRRAGHACGLLGTIQYSTGSQKTVATRTTPESPEVQKMLKEMADNHLSHAVMEVSSHALALHRVTDCHFSAAVFTNLSPDHLDFHGSMDAYLSAKARLFRYLSVSAAQRRYAVLNADDTASERLAQEFPGDIVWYGMHASPKATLRRGTFIRARGVQWGYRAVSFEVLISDSASSTPLSITLQLPGLGNVYNALAAMAVCLCEGIPAETAAEALAALDTIPGRGEFIDCGQDFTILVDYAHNRGALEQILATARQLASGPVILVFGGEGGKERLRRRPMGEAAGRLADLCIITSDNMYGDEDPLDVARDVEEGIMSVEPSQRAAHAIITDRYEAIRQALQAATPGSIVVVAGKGHEKEWVIGETRIPFDDREVVRSLLLALKPNLQTSRNR